MRRIVPITVTFIFVTHDDKKKDIFVQIAGCSSSCLYSQLKHWSLFPGNGPNGHNERIHFKLISDFSLVSSKSAF